MFKISSSTSPAGDASWSKTSALVEPTENAYSTVKITLKLPHMSPVVFGSAPPQTAITAVKSLMWESIDSRRLNDVGRLFLVVACFSRALVWLRSSWALATSRTQSSSCLTSERNRDKALEKSGLCSGLTFRSEPTNLTTLNRERESKYSLPRWFLGHLEVLNKCVKK